MYLKATEFDIKMHLLEGIAGLPRVRHPIINIYHKYIYHKQNTPTYISRTMYNHIYCTYPRVTHIFFTCTPLICCIIIALSRKLKTDALRKQ